MFDIDCFTRRHAKPFFGLCSSYDLSEFRECIGNNPNLSSLRTASGTITLFLDSPDGQSEQVGIFTDQDIMRSAGVGPRKHTSSQQKRVSCMLNMNPGDGILNKYTIYSDLFSPDFR